MTENKYRYPTDRLWSVKEAADICDVTPRTIRNWIHDGELPAIIYGAGARRPTYKLEPEVVLSRMQATARGSNPYKEKNHDGSSQTRKRVDGRPYVRVARRKQGSDPKVRREDEEGGSEG